MAAAGHRFSTGIGGQRALPGLRVPAVAVERDAHVQGGHGATRFSKATG